MMRIEGLDRSRRGLGYMERHGGTMPRAIQLWSLATECMDLDGVDGPGSASA